MKDNSNPWLGIRKSLKLYEQMLKGVCIPYQLTGIEEDVISFLQHNPGKDTAMDMVELRPVSYTQLDVYKRQGRLFVRVQH